MDSKHEDIGGRASCGTNYYCEVVGISATDSISRFQDTTSLKFSTISKSDRAGVALAEGNVSCPCQTMGFVVNE